MAVMHLLPGESALTLEHNPSVDLGPGAVDDLVPDSLVQQEAMQPEAVATGLVTTRPRGAP
jgi:hypothetical protein